MWHRRLSKSQRALSKSQRALSKSERGLNIRLLAGAGADGLCGIRQAGAGHLALQAPYLRVRMDLPGRIILAPGLSGSRSKPACPASN